MKGFAGWNEWKDYINWKTDYICSFDDVLYEIKVCALKSKLVLTSLDGFKETGNLDTCQPSNTQHHDVCLV